MQHEAVQYVLGTAMRVLLPASNAIGRLNYRPLVHHVYYHMGTIALLYAKGVIAFTEYLPGTSTAIKTTHGGHMGTSSSP